MAKGMTSCKHHQSAQTNKEMTCGTEDSNCCQNKAMFVDADLDEQVFNHNLFNSELQYFVVALVNTFLFNQFQEKKKVLAFKIYKPPQLSKDISVLFEIFLL